jgi:hypothetical protein
VLVFFLLSLFFVLPAMVFLEELVNRNDPKIGHAFIQKLKLLDGMFSFPNIMEANEPMLWHFHMAGIRLDVNIQSLDGLFGAAAVNSWAECQDKLLEQLFGKHDVAADEEVYYHYWKYLVTGMVMVAQVHCTKFSISDPILLSVTFPTILPRGHTSEVFVEPSPTAQFMPGQGLLPQQGTLPFLCGMVQSCNTTRT